MGFRYNIDMNREIELLAPGGDIDSIKAAIVAGADAIYCGLDSFNARNRAANITLDDLNGVVRLAHKSRCQVFVTLNIIILESELPAIFRLLNKLVNTQIDGVIVQDTGLFYLLDRYFTTLDVHASTQVTTHNKGQISFLSKLKATRANLSRELNLNEIRELTDAAHEKSLLTEVFVHGSSCIGFSGLCYISSLHGGNSGNRGRCSQPCRDQYKKTRVGVDYPLNIKDNSAFSDFEGLVDTGVDSLKIEGRIKKFHYVYTVVDSWRKQIDSFLQSSQERVDGSDLYKVFNRGFSDGYLTGDINKNMFIDNPRDNSVKHFTELKGYAEGSASDEEIQLVKQEIYDTKTDIITAVAKKIEGLSVAKIPLYITVFGERNSPLKVTVKTPDSSLEYFSESTLVDAKGYCVDRKNIEKSFKGLNNATCQIEALNIEPLQDNLFIPFKQLNVIRNQILSYFNGSKSPLAPVEKPRLQKQPPLQSRAMLSVLISDEKDLGLCEETSAEIYYQLPECIHSEYDRLIELFSNNRSVIPWFPSIIIGEDYAAAVRLIEQLQPEQIVTNNSGVAYVAYEQGISWVAGPHLNTTNSFTLLSLKEEFGCSGAFISNEINKMQTQQIVRPADFKRYSSIYHPILLLTSRQCLFHQTTGCEKESMDEHCLPDCKRAVSIINLKESTFLIDKQRGGYNSMYNSINFLNTEILNDLPDTFSSFFVDLREIKTKTKIKTEAGKDKAAVVHAFENLLAGEVGSEEVLAQMVHPTTNGQYRKGL